MVTEEKRKPGRPGKNSTTTTVYRQKLSHSLDEAAVHKTRERLCCFVLTTNLDQSYSAHRVFKEYKAQRNVEVSFEFLKDPLFVGPVFLKRFGGIEALAYVLLIALLIYSLLKKRVHETLNTKQSLC